MDKIIKALPHIYVERVRSIPDVKRSLSHHFSQSFTTQSQIQTLRIKYQEVKQRGLRQKKY